MATRGQSSLGIPPSCRAAGRIWPGRPGARQGTPTKRPGRVREGLKVHELSPFALVGERAEDVPAEIVPRCGGRCGADGSRSGRAQACRPRASAAARAARRPPARRPRLSRLRAARIANPPPPAAPGGPPDGSSGPAPARPADARSRAPKPIAARRLQALMRGHRTLVLDAVAVRGDQARQRLGERVRPRPVDWKAPKALPLTPIDPIAAEKLHPRSRMVCT